MGAPFPRMNRVAIGLGSNLGDRLANLRAALYGLRAHAELTAVSGVWETRPVGSVDQPDFLNACTVGWSRQTPRQLLSSLLDLERALGRRRGEDRRGPRTIDLDLLLYDDVVMSMSGLRIPHPRMRERAFVLMPLCEIAPDWRVAEAGGTGTTVAELAANVSSDGVERTNLRIGDD